MYFSTINRQEQGSSVKYCYNKSHEIDLPGNQVAENVKKIKNPPDGGLFMN